MVRPSPKQLADAEARSRLRQYHKLLLSPPGPAGKPVAVVIAAAKNEVGHGNWEAWLKAEFGWTQKTAVSYMNVYKTFGKTEPGSDLLSVSISIDAKALYALAAPTGTAAGATT